MRSDMGERVVRLEDVVRTAEWVPVVRNAAQLVLLRAATPQTLRRLEIDALAYQLDGIRTIPSMARVAASDERRLKKLREDPKGTDIRGYAERWNAADMVVYYYQEGNRARKQVR